MKKTVFLLILIILILKSVSGQFNRVIGNYKPYNFPRSFKIHETDSFFFLRAASYTGIILMKTNKQGILLKQTIIPDTAYNYGISSVLAGNKIIIVTSFMDSLNISHGRIIAVDFNLDTLWTNDVFSNYILSTYVSNVNLQNTFQQIVQTPDKGFIIAGAYAATSGYIRFCPYLIKTDSLFNVHWFRNYQRTGEMITNLKLTHDLGIMMIFSRNLDGIVKTNALGYVQWKRTPSKTELIHFMTDFDHVGNDYFIFATLHRVYLSSSNSYYYNIYIRKINGLTGQLIWDSIYSPVHNACQSYANSDSPLRVFGQNNGTAHIYGDGYIPNTSSSQMYSGAHRVGFNMMISPSGDSLDLKKYFYLLDPVSGTKQNFLYDIIENQDTKITTGFGVFNKYNFNGPDSSGYWFFQTNKNGILGLYQKQNTSTNKFLIYPNPASSILNIEIKNTLFTHTELEIYDITGKKILVSNVILNKGNNRFTIDISSFTQGVYFIRIISNNGIYMQKFIVR